MPEEFSPASSIAETPPQDRKPWGGAATFQPEPLRPDPRPERRSCASSAGPAPRGRAPPRPARPAPPPSARARARALARKSGSPESARACACSRSRRRHFGAISPAAPNRSRAGPEPPAGCARVRRRRAAGRAHVRAALCRPSARHLCERPGLPRALEEPPRPPTPEPAGQGITSLTIEATSGFHLRLTISQDIQPRGLNNYWIRSQHGWTSQTVAYKPAKTLP